MQIIKYILLAIDYFTKWVEAASYKSVTKVVVAQFLKHNIIYCYGMLGELITNNRANLNGKMIHNSTNSSRSSIEIWLPIALR